MGCTMNPSNWEPPHLLVLERVDWSDRSWHGFEGSLECPYPIREYTTYTDPGLEPGWNGRAQSTEYGHDTKHYCTITLNMDWPSFRAKPLKPKLTMRSTWRDEGVVRQCARIEINASAGAQYGTCMYHECVSNVGLQEAFADYARWNRWHQGKLNKPEEFLPDRPGTYPVYYWSSGYGEDFVDGLTFEYQPAEDLWADDVITRIRYTSSAPS